MKYDEIEQLRTHHPAWALLRSNNAALVLSFLGRVFVDDDAGDVAASALASELDEELYALNQRLGEETFPRSASEYLDDWASPDHGWLRKFYPAGSDEAQFDLVPAVEKALAMGGRSANQGVHRYRVPPEHHFRVAAPDGLRRGERSGAPAGRAAAAPGASSTRRSPEPSGVR